MSQETAEIKLENKVFNYRLLSALKEKKKQLIFLHSGTRRDTSRWIQDLRTPDLHKVPLHFSMEKMVFSDTVDTRLNSSQRNQVFLKFHICSSTENFRTAVNLLISFQESHIIRWFMRTWRNSTKDFLQSASDGILASMIAAMSTFYPWCIQNRGDVDLTIQRLMAKCATVAAWSYKKIYRTSSNVSPKQIVLLRELPAHDVCTTNRRIPCQSESSGCSG